MPLYDIACHDCDVVTEQFIPLADFEKILLPCRCGGARYRKISTPAVMADIQPYQAMGVDVATGTAPMITSRSQHRDYLRRNNYVEVGNEVPAPKRTEAITDKEIGRQVKQVIDSKAIKL